MFHSNTLPLAVFPVLVGPLQTLLALLPAILVGVGSMVFAAFKPRGFVRLAKFCWRQKLFFGCVAAVVALWQYGIPSRWVRGQSVAVNIHASAGTDWESARGGSRRLGRGPGELDATASGVVWSNTRDKTVLSSPAVSGDRIIFSTATDIGPFTPMGRGAIACVEASTGREVWRYAPDNYRGTFSSPVVSGNSVVCGEGLHQVEDARVTCLDVRTGERRWEFRTKSHVEATPAIADGRVFIGAGGDGFYCLSLEPDPKGQPHVLWHLKADDFADCESSPVIHEGVVYFGLGEGGAAVCAVKAETGELLWKLDTPYPVFAPPTVVDGKLLIATGNGNYVQSAADLLEMKLQILRDDGATEQQLSDARERLKPVGEAWCIDLSTRAIDWKYSTGDAILGAIVHAGDSIYFGSRDGCLYRVSPAGELLNKYDLHEPVISSAALGQMHIYCTTASGRLYCLDRLTLKPAWDSSLGSGTTFSSSPTVAHGHVYIGTAENGLRCLGRPGEPDPPLWANCEFSGSADDVVVPEGDLVELWSYPDKSQQKFQVTRPLMFLDSFLVAAGHGDGQSELVKLDVSGKVPAESWRRKFNGSICAGPVGSGDRIFIVEELPVSPFGRLHCVTATGTVDWSEKLPPVMTRHSVGITLDRQRVFVWDDYFRLTCFDQKSGKLLLNIAVASPHAFDGTEFRSFAPAVGHGLLVSVVSGKLNATSQSVTPWAELSVLDAATGTKLWRVDLPEIPTGGPQVDGDAIAIPYQDHVAMHRLLDGALTGTQPSTPPLTERLPTKRQDLATPVVSHGGRIYFGTEEGQIMCLGTGQP